jgi:hypothetical protein
LPAPSITRPPRISNVQHGASVLVVGREFRDDSRAIWALPASKPPSTRYTSPVIHDASSDARTRLRWATSSGSPTRRSGTSE